MFKLHNVIKGEDSLLDILHLDIKYLTERGLTIK